MDDQLILYYSKPKKFFLAFFIGIIAIFMGWGAYRAFNDGKMLFGIFASILSFVISLAFIKIILQYLSNEPQVIIDRNGIEIVELKRGPICWEDVEEVTTGEFRIKYSSQKYLGLKLKRSSKHWKQPSTADQVAGEINNALRVIRFSEDDEALFRIFISGYNVGTDKVWTHIVKLKDLYHIPISLREMV